MANLNWLTLMEYSNRYKVSISTLRRKIKSNDIVFQFTDGKYFILDDSSPTQTPAPGPETIVPPKVRSSQDQEPKAQPAVMAVPPPPSQPMTTIPPMVQPSPVPPVPVISQPQAPVFVPTEQTGARVCASAEPLVGELKKAYSMILQEKEEQILQLREEVSDLQTLVRVLENEVQRLGQEKKRERQPEKKAPEPSFESRSNTLGPLKDYDLNLELDQF